MSTCENCWRYPDWTIDRVGDAAVVDACTPHLADVIRRFQRPWEITELHVRPARRAVRVFRRSDGSWRSKCFLCRPPVWPDLEPTSWEEAQAAAVLHAQIYHAKTPDPTCATCHTTHKFGPCDGARRLPKGRRA